MKYKFRFKALDDIDPKFRWEAEHKFTEFYEQLYKVKMGDGNFTNRRDSNDDTVYEIKLETLRIDIEIFVNFHQMTVKKLITDGKGANRDSRYMRFNNVQLRFFENLGFDLDKEFAKETGQKIDDWFKKEY